MKHSPMTLGCRLQDFSAAFADNPAKIMMSITDIKKYLGIGLFISVHNLGLFTEGLAVRDVRGFSVSFAP
jgi:hypothetical protein